MPMLHFRGRSTGEQAHGRMIGDLVQESREGCSVRCPNPSIPSSSSTRSILWTIPSWSTSWR